MLITLLKWSAISLADYSGKYLIVTSLLLCINRNEIPSTNMTSNLTWYFHFFTSTCSGFFLIPHPLTSIIFFPKISWECWQSLSFKWIFCIMFAHTGPSTSDWLGLPIVAWRYLPAIALSTSYFVYPLYFLQIISTIITTSPLYS